MNYSHAQLCQLFAYTARETASGREIRNTVEALSEQAAIAALLNRNLLVVEIKEKMAKRGQTKGGKVQLADLVVFTRQLATMIDAGIAIVQSLQALAEQTPNKVMRDTIKDVCSRVEAGESFSEALIRHPKAFNRLYVSMVGAGEKGGLLAEILARLATYLENTERLRKKVKTALMYPTVVTIVAIVITIFLLVRVIPTFKEVYSGFGAKLPGPTEFMIDISEIVQHYLIYLIVLAGVGVWGWLYFIKTKAGPGILGHPAHQAARLRRQSPTKSASPGSRARWPRWSAAACRFWKSCRSSRKPSATPSWKKPSKPPRTDIERGEGISAALGKHPVFPTMIIRMLSAGEQTGNIDNMLERVADFLDEEIETTLSGLMSLIEPLLIVFPGRRHRRHGDLHVPAHFQPGEHRQRRQVS